MRRIGIFLLWILLCHGYVGAQTRMNRQEAEKGIEAFFELQDKNPKEALKSITLVANALIGEDELTFLARYLRADFRRKQNPNQKIETDAWLKIVSCGAALDQEQILYDRILITALACRELTGEGVKVQYRPAYMLKASLLLQRLPEDLSVLYRGKYGAWYRKIGLDAYDKERIGKLADELRENLLAYSGEELYVSADTKAMKYANDAEKNDEDILLAIELTRLAMEKNHPDAFALYGDYLSGGYGMEKDLQQMVRMYEQAAQGGSCRGVCCYAEYLLEGKVVPRNEKLAYELLNRVKEHDHFFAYGGGVLLGGILERGEAVAADPAEAGWLYLMSVEKGGTQKKREEAYALYRNLQLRRDREVWIASIPEDVSTLTEDDLCFLGWSFLHMKDLENSVRYYSLAHERGSGKAANALGNLHFDAGDYENAVNFFGIAARRRYLAGVHNFAVCLYFGIGTTPIIRAANGLSEIFFEEFARGEYEYFESDELISRHFGAHIDDVAKHMRRRGIEIPDALELVEWFKWIMSLHCKKEEYMEGLLLEKLLADFKGVTPYIRLTNRYIMHKDYEKALYYQECLIQMGHTKYERNAKILREKIN